MSVARTALIPISLLGTCLIWSIGRRLYGNASGLVAATFWCFSPSVLTFGASITPDVSAAVFGLLASWRFYIWLRLGTVHNALLLGGSLALAMLSKTTWVILPPILIAVGMIYAWQVGKRWMWKNRWKQIALVVGTAWILVHACYDFQGTLRPLGEFEFTSRTLTGIGDDRQRFSSTTGNRFRGTWLEHIPAPLPVDFIRGIDIQKRDFERKMDSYFLGTLRDHGWWYYYLVGILLKEPVALWIMATSVWGCALWFGRAKLSQTKRTCQLVVMLPGIAVLALVSSQTGFNHHLRYVLPFFPCLYLLVARPVSVCHLS